jgi:hypothetical protein
VGVPVGGGVAVDVPAGPGAAVIVGVGVALKTRELPSPLPPHPAIPTSRQIADENDDRRFHKTAIPTPRYKAMCHISQ